MTDKQLDVAAWEYAFFDDATAARRVSPVHPDEDPDIEPGRWEGYHKHKSGAEPLLRVSDIREQLLHEAVSEAVNEFLDKCPDEGFVEHPDQFAMSVANHITDKQKECLPETTGDEDGDGRGE